MDSTPLFRVIPRLFMAVRDPLKTQELRKETVHMEPKLLAYASDHL